MNEYVFVRYDDNWADEFDVESIWVVRKEVFDAWVKKVTKWVTSEQEIYFGTNEFITIDSGKKAVKACKVSSISEPEAQVIAKWLGQEGDELEEDGIEIGQIHIFSSLEDIAEQEANDD